MIARVLAIAGSDSGGGAGIQADIKTITMLGGYAMTAVTAITVQNTLGVTAVHAIPDEIVQGQIRAVVDDIGVDAIKIGMLGNAATIAAVAEALDAVAEVPIVLDPVMVAKGGSRLLEAGAISALKAGLLSRAALVTPNAPELAVLTGRDVRTETEMLRAGRALLRAGAAAVLAKGGHLQGDTVVDWLLTAEAETRFAAPRRDTPHTHGTGCTLSSAVATGLAKGLSLVEAVAEARDYLQAAMDAAPGLGRGHGPLGHNFALL